MGRPAQVTKMTALVRQWRASGEPQARFARRHGVQPWTLWYWSQKIGRARPPRKASPTAFVPVAVVPDAPPVTLAIEVTLGSGERLVIPTGVSREQIAAVVAALRAPC